jgi:hypothetical protein
MREHNQGGNCGIEERGERSAANQQLLLFLTRLLYGTASPPDVRNGFAFPFARAFRLGCALL